ncbi:Sulfatase [Thermincola ferriacetica]|uniref:Sulfatase n=1 Tax=Thermincola ferriacetica TaxID=281456 RepID=A0A0L6W4K9_9FIRM|nr:sulfatase-like hydrolase/transferase [Thermincola ferriacetica]KNZ70034.1 Sulfatase [Thermincola ferriacetica]
MIFNRNMDKSQDNIHTEQEPKMSNFYLIHPILFAIYPIIFLYSYNVQETSFKQIVLPVGISVAFSLLFFLTLTVVLRNRLKAGLVTTFFLMAFYSYGRIFDVLNDYWKWSFNIAQHRYVLPTMLLLVWYAGSLIHDVKNQVNLEKLSRIFTILGLTLIVINLFNVMPNEINKKQTDIKENKVVKQAYARKSDMPDIYYIILDEYASLDTIKNIWNYDNTEFENSLSKKGFYICRNSTSKYTDTYKSLAASLNMNYLPENISEADVFKMLSNNRVMNFLKGNGYKTVYIGNWYDISRYKMNVDFQYNFYLDSNLSYVDEFSLILIKSSMLKPFEYLFGMSYTDGNTYRSSVLYSFNKLKQLPHVEGPKFVFAHILSPHTPFVFDRNGGQVNQINSRNWKDKKYYLNQYIYISNQVDSLVSELISQSKMNPIIIVQSDHGPRPNNSPKEEENFEIPDIDKHKIFNAYYLPNLDKGLLREDISPVNTFRIIFNNYFGQKLKLLHDK